MTKSTLDLAAAIYKEAQYLPPESLADVMKYIEFLRFKAEQEATQQEAPDKEAQKMTIVTLRGILAGYDVSPEALAEARREMWQGFGEAEGQGRPYDG